MREGMEGVWWDDAGGGEGEGQTGSTRQCALSHDGG